MDAEIQAFIASLEAQPSYTQSTRLAYGSDLRIFRDYLQKTLDRSPSVVDLNKSWFTQFIEAERTAGRKHNTLLRRRAALQRFEVFLRQNNLLTGEGFTADMDETPIAKLEDLGETTLHCLDETEINCLQTYLSQFSRPVSRRDQAILAILLETGLSVSELIRLDVLDLDLAARRFRIVAPDGSESWMPLGNAQTAVENYLNLARPELNPTPGEPALLISQLGARMSRQSIWQVLRNAGRGAGFGYTLSPRIIRHTAALRLVRTGRPLSDIQLLLGHTNPLSTQALIHRLESANPQMKW